MRFYAIRFVSGKFSISKNRNGFVNFVWWAGVFSIALGVVALVVSLSVLDGFYNAIQENAIRFTSHIKIYTFNRQSISNPELIVKRIIEEIPEVDNAYPSISKEVLIRTKKNVEGVSLQSLHKRNLDGLRRIETLPFFKDIYQAEGIFVGKMLAERLGLKLGDTVLLVAIKNYQENNLPNPSFTKAQVIGIFESGMAKYDDLFAFANRTVFYKLSGDEKPFQLVNSIDVYVKDLERLDSVATKIEKTLGYPFFCFTFYDLHSSIFAWIELQKEPIPIVLSLITIVAIFNVVTFLLVCVVEKTKSIGILSTIGLTTKEIAFVFLHLGQKISLYGLSIGIGLSFLFSLVQKYFGVIRLDSKVYFFDKLPISISLFNYLIVIIFTFVLTIITSLIPSIIASKVNPVRAIRFIK
ncbi:MAG: ABC transporter permease [Ignavibacteria bacterium]|nr:ABC transporter permease [Ignavibacteria bacterium]